MAMTLPKSLENAEITLLKLAREVAIDLHDIETILKRYQISPETWEDIKQNRYFNDLVKSEVEAWQSALNTSERTKLKSQAMIEEWLPEAYARLHSASENLSAKVELAKLIARIAGMGIATVGTDGSVGERFTVTINLGGDKLTYDKSLPPKVIEASPTE
jgi:hypothetical protein